MLPIIKWLLKLFKEIKNCVRETPVEDHPFQEALEDHFLININKGWMKLQKYYKLLDNTPVYYTAVILHPHLKNYCRNAWINHLEWLKQNKEQFIKFWQQYKQAPLSQLLLLTQPLIHVHTSFSRDNYIKSIAAGL